MSHPHSALHIYQFLSSLHQSSPPDFFNAILLSFRTPRFSPVSAIAERWGPLVHGQVPSSGPDFDQLMASAMRSPSYDTLLIQVADHYPLIYRVSCFLESDLELESFVRCLGLSNKNKEGVQQALREFVEHELPPDTRDFVQEIIMEDPHGYFWVDNDDGGVLDLDKVYGVMQDPALFDQCMAIIQANTANRVIWSQTMQEIYELVASKGIWEHLAPLLEQVYAKTDTQQYNSYEEYVQKNFLDDGGQEYLDEEIHRAQVEHMFSNLKM